jgi:hypothetical protein
VIFFRAPSPVSEAPAADLWPLKWTADFEFDRALEDGQRQQVIEGPAKRFSADYGPHLCVCARRCPTCVLTELGGNLLRQKHN